MRLIFSAVRAIRRQRRRLFGPETPHWATDLYKAFGFLNVLELIPSVFAVLLAPGHLFRRIPMVTRKRKSGVKSIYRPPIQFAMQVIALVAAVVVAGLSRFKPNQYSQTSLKLELALGLVTLPLTIPLVCAALILAGYVIRLFLQAGTPGAGNWIRTMSMSLVIPLDPHTYLNLDWKRYFWGLFYYFGYLITVPLFILAPVAAIVAAIFIGVERLFAYMGRRNPADFMLVAMLAAVLFLAVTFSIVRPYLRLLSVSLKRPTRWLFRAGVYGLELASRTIVEVAKKNRIDRPELKAPKLIKRHTAARKELAPAMLAVREEFAKLFFDRQAPIAAIPLNQKKVLRTMLVSLPFAELQRLAPYLPLGREDREFLSVLLGLSESVPLAENPVIAPSEAGIKSLAKAIEAVESDAKSLMRLRMQSGGDEEADEKIAETIRKSLTEEIPRHWIGVAHFADAPWPEGLEKKRISETADRLRRLGFDLAEYPLSQKAFQTIGAASEPIIVPRTEIQAAATAASGKLNAPKNYTPPS